MKHGACAISKSPPIILNSNNKFSVCTSWNINLTPNKNNNQRILQQRNTPDFLFPTDNHVSKSAEKRKRAAEGVKSVKVVNRENFNPNKGENQHRKHTRTNTQYRSKPSIRSRNQKYEHK